jgi:hypothetical protein
VMAPTLIQSRYKKLRKAAKQLTAESSMEDYHLVRGRIKKLRYVLDAERLRHAAEPEVGYIDVFVLEVAIEHLERNLGKSARSGRAPRRACFDGSGERGVGQIAVA